jgi:archaemetzincin
LNGNVCIYPIGSVDGFLLEHLAECINKVCGLDCKIGKGIGIPRYAFNQIRNQYDSKLILKNLVQLCGDNHWLIGVTHVDLYVSILKYVFGIAQIQGQCSIVSLYRLRPEFYEKPTDLTLLLSRLSKTALHELGHGVGLTHCRNRDCVMYSSVSIEDTDHKSIGYCPTCLELFKWFQNEAGPRNSRLPN